jgi:hypothetical protein
MHKAVTLANIIEEEAEDPSETISSEGCSPRTDRQARQGSPESCPLLCPMRLCFF